MFKTRLLSGILLVVIALITVITGGNVLFATLFLISMIGVYELYRVFEIENKAVGICGFLFVADTMVWCMPNRCFQIQRIGSCCYLWHL